VGECKPLPRGGADQRRRGLPYDCGEAALGADAGVTPHHPLLAVQPLGRRLLQGRFQGLGFRVHAQGLEFTRPLLGLTLHTVELTFQVNLSRIRHLTDCRHPAHPTKSV
jgi:hypothetical protein